MSKSISGMHDPYEDQLAAARYRAERDALAQAMQRVADSMRDHALGVEGMEDSPVSGWERELRAALGGMEHIGTMIEYRRVLNGVCKRLGLTDGTGMPEQDGVIYEALDRRLMPEGMEWLIEAWPKFEDDAPVAFHDKGLDIHGRTRSVEGVKFTQGGFVFISDDMGNAWWASDCGPMEDPEIDPDKRVKRPAPKVLDSEGVECNVGDAVWWVHNKTGNFRIIRIEKDGKCAIHDDEADEPCGMTVPSTELTHKRPVLDADGKPLREGETVYLTYSPTAFVVDDIMTREDGATVVHLKDGAWNLPQYLTHQRPVLDADGKPLQGAGRKGEPK